eukprot:TRINITY_DN109442_c0_g1_i1.p1 TRINITY_DN109442_c0_g1~~TRINITY_DN109442_c0_g1_i1.p1  ORF type:complete len:309 (+),score=87.23 TRINITY_DN109442_c0_g1_i1:72-998(+)
MQAAAPDASMVASEVIDLENEADEQACGVVDLVESDDDEKSHEGTACPAAAVLCVGTAAGASHGWLFQLLQQRSISNLVDARSQTQGSVAQLRRASVASSIFYEWQPAIGGTGSGAEAGARAAEVTRLAAAAWRVATAKGPRAWPCVLFAGQDWHSCPARQRLAGELSQRGVELWHARQPPEKDELHQVVPPELREAAAKSAAADAAAAPKIALAAGVGSAEASSRQHPPKAVELGPVPPPSNVNEALEEAANLWVGWRQAAKSGGRTRKRHLKEVPSTCQQHSTVEVLSDDSDEVQRSRSPLDARQR